MQIKITMRYHLIPVRMAIIKKVGKKKKKKKKVASNTFRQGYGEKGTLVQAVSSLFHLAQCPLGSSRLSQMAEFPSF